jgi:hypothetical protein
MSSDSADEPGEVTVSILGTPRTKGGEPVPETGSVIQGPVLPEPVRLVVVDMLGERSRLGGVGLQTGRYGAARPARVDPVGATRGYR